MASTRQLATRFVQMRRALTLLAQPVQRRGRPNFTALKAWIEQHMPELDRELGPMTHDQVRIRLNAITGCTIGPADPIESGSAVFLAALKTQDGAWRTEA